MDEYIKIFVASINSCMDIIKAFVFVSAVVLFWLIFWLFIF